MDTFTAVVSDLLVEIYYDVLRLEELALKKDTATSLSINEMHLIEIVGYAEEEGVTISELAERLHISRPSTTVAVNKLQKKGFVTKRDCEKDGRVVRVFLPAEGKKIFAYHKYYHRNMVNALCKEFTDEEKDVMIRAIGKLNDYFKRSVGEKS